MKFLPLYFDPGTGALIVQAIVAVGASIALFYRRIVTAVRSVFGKKQQDNLMGNIDDTDNNDAA
ncbi:hypothetical protein ACLI1A_06135 [Flavobacterium sp. RHBU_3]|uniref:hypothetical protein n=1 Tax=Flavobacterium sp. RHBU_3 TaxID=3391184 RepID=UPI003985235F